MDTLTILKLHGHDDIIFVHALDMYMHLLCTYALGNVGLIPRICEGLFDQTRSSNTSITYTAKVSYLEIYNENVRDLLVNSASSAVNLKAREHPSTGPYVEGLSVHEVNSYQGIQSLMDLGNSNRVTASTGMNDTSSRSHAVFTMIFNQASFDDGVPSEKISKLNLVDLAGSERSSGTQATGIRLREGANINKSLTTLGLVLRFIPWYSVLSHELFFHPRYTNHTLGSPF